MAQGCGEDKMTWRFVAIFVATCTASCSKPSEAPTRVHLNPVGIAIVCKDAQSEPTPCDGDSVSSREAFVLDLSRQAIGLSFLPYGDHYDFDPFTPGFNLLKLKDWDGKVLEDLVAIESSKDSKYVYVLSRSPPGLVRIGTKDFSQAFVGFDSDCTAESFSLVEIESSDPFALVACSFPWHGVLKVLLNHFDSGNIVITRIDIQGSPGFVSVSPDGRYAFVTHKFPFQNNVSKLEIETGRIESVALFDDPTPAVSSDCADGIDNDYDGFVDGLDPECIAGSPSEFPLIHAPACSNGKDDDKDGMTDQEDPGCEGVFDDDESEDNIMVVQKPVVAPDGSLVYVPHANPHGISVLSIEPFHVVNVNEEGSKGYSVVLARLGRRDIVLQSAPTSVVFRKDGDEVKGFAGLSSGQIVRFSTNPPTLEMAQETPAPFATMPDLEVQEKKYDRSVDPFYEYPSFGEPVVSLLPGTQDQYSYYGIVFQKNSNDVLSERWQVEYEGVLPNAKGNWGFFFIQGAQFKDPSKDFCSLGVEAGDHLIVKDPPYFCYGQKGQTDATCPAEAKEDTGVVNLCEFEVADVFEDKLVLKPIDGFKGFGELERIPQPFEWEIRVSDAFTVVGSATGFLHAIEKGEDGRCKRMEKADLRLTGRAFLSRPLSGLSACPPDAWSNEVEWQTFANMAFTFNIFPPCLTNEDLTVSLCEVVRGTLLSFGVNDGRLYYIANVGGYPSDIKVSGSLIYAVNATSGAIHLIDPTTMTIYLTVY